VLATARLPTRLRLVAHGLESVYLAVTRSSMLVPINGAVSFAIRDSLGVAGVAEPPGAPGF